MTAVTLLDSLRDFIAEQVKEYAYEFTRPGKIIETKSPVVYSGYLPIRTSHEVEYSPCVIVKLVKINDNQDETSADVRIVFTVHDEDNTDNWRSQLNIMEHVRQALLMQRTIANKFRLSLPLSYEPSENSQLPYPEGYGFLNATYSIGQPIEEDLLREYYGKEL